MIFHAVREKHTIQMLYQIEKLFKNSTPEERYQERQKQAKPLLDAFFAWLHTLKSDDLDHKTLFGDAILYTLNQEPYLRCYLENGHLNIDNNPCERMPLQGMQKNFAIGRRVWLFRKSIRGAQSSAIFYRIVETAKFNGSRTRAETLFLFDLYFGNHGTTSNGYQIRFYRRTSLLVRDTSR